MNHHYIRRLALPVLVTGACLAIPTSPAYGGLCLWSGLGDNPRFGNQLNWAPDPVPGATDRAAFDLGGAFDVLFMENEMNLDLLVLDGSLTFRTDPASVARRCYTINGDTFVEGGTLTIGGLDLLVANHLFVDDGGELIVAFDESGPFGTANVNVGNALAVGTFDTGTVAIEKCGTLISTHAFLAEWPDSVATVRLDEIGSTWLNETDTFLADYGEGLLDVRNGGMAIFGGRLGLANQPGSFATAIVDGPGSMVYTWDALQVGLDGDAAILVTDGAELLSMNSDIGVYTGEGSVLVDGPGSRWISGIDNRIGRYGSGLLTICNGATVEMQHARVGDFDGSSGSALVICPDARWDLADALWIGRRGSGGLTIADGGHVTSIYGAIGREATGNGNVTVLGGNARWEIDQSLAIGGSPSSEGGTGTLTILGDSAIEVGGTMRIWSDGSVLLAAGLLGATHIDHSRYGSFTFTGGTLHTEFFEGNLWNDGGTLAPGRSVGMADIAEWNVGDCVDPDWLTGQTVVDGWYVQTEGVLEIDLLTPAARRNDRLVVTLDAHIAGDLVVRMLGGFVPDPFDEFVILEADSLVGEFENAPITVPLEGGGWFNVIYDRTPGAAQVRLIGFVPPPPCPSDFDGDGRSGFADLCMMLEAWGECSHCVYDLDEDGVVGLFDLSMLMRAWGDCP